MRRLSFSQHFVLLAGQQEGNVAMTFVAVKKFDNFVYTQSGMSSSNQATLLIDL